MVRKVSRRAPRSKPNAKPKAKRSVTKKAARARSARATPRRSVAISKVLKYYGLPQKGITGAGQKVAIISMGGGYEPRDLKRFFGPSGPKVTVKLGSDSPDADPSELTQQIEMLGSVAPKARIWIYFAESSADYPQAIEQAIADGADVISTSHSGAEGTASTMNAVNALFKKAAAAKISVFASSGDSGSGDPSGDSARQCVHFPASSPWCTACGGTSLNLEQKTEVVWNDAKGATGGGVSAVFPRPKYQDGLLLPGGKKKLSRRGVPDVAAHASPLLAYEIFVGGTKQPAGGGTSITTPLWAGIAALLNQALKRRLGLLNPYLYALGGKGFNDITEGNNRHPPLKVWDANTGWDPCTGLGSPRFEELLAAIRALK